MEVSYVSAIKDPEHPLTLEELNVVDKSLIQVVQHAIVCRSTLSRSALSR